MRQVVSSNEIIISDAGNLEDMRTVLL